MILERDDCAVVQLIGETHAATCSPLHDTGGHRAGDGWSWVHYGKSALEGLLEQDQVKESE